MARVRSIRDVVDHRLCIGCGACVHVLGQGAARMVDIPDKGLRPKLLRPLSAEEDRKALAVCPGLTVNAGAPEASVADPAAGRALRVWAGYAADSEIRFHGSSGGVLTALSSYCLEHGKADFVAHTGMDSHSPWKNRSTVSRNRAELLQQAGSRYAPSSPCDLFSTIESSSGKAVFIGKPCDIAALRLTERRKPHFSERIAAVLTFFCAGTPSSQSVYELAREALGDDADQISRLKFRGEGWPGEFRVSLNGNGGRSLYSYETSWGRLQATRGLRCQLCADGMGELADVSCGDAWHRYNGDGNPGLSIVVARTQRGLDLVEEAIERGYLILDEVEPAEIAASQGSDSGIANRRRATWGRLLVLRLLGIPRPQYVGFPLFSAWRQLPLRKKAKSVVGTVVRVFRKRLYTRDYSHPGSGVR